MKSFPRYSLFLICASLILSACFSQPQNSVVSSENESPVVSSDVSESESISESESQSEIDPPTVMSKREVLNQLASTPFSAKITTEDDIALDDIPSVGVDEDKLLNEELYPVPEKTSDVHVYSAKDDAGLYYGAVNNAGTLSNFINSIKDVQGIKIIEFEDITYDIKSPITIESVQDLYLVGKEHTMFLASGWQTYIIAKNCKNLHLNNIRFDIEHSPTISGVISSFTESDGYTDVVLDIPDEFDMNYSGYKNFDASTDKCSYMECFYDSENGRYVPDTSHNLYYNASTLSDAYGVMATSCSTGQMTVRLRRSFPYCSYRTPVVGTHVSFAFTMYEFFGLSFEACEELYLENTNLYVSAGMGIHFMGGKNIYLNRANFRCREDSQRIMTCTADIIHSVTVQNDLKITNCILEASHDDALNIKTWYQRIGEASKIQSKYLIRQGSEKPDTRYDVGDIIELIDKTTMQRVKKFEVIESTKNGTNFEIKVKGIDGAKVDQNDTQYYVGNDSKATHLYLHNCLIQHKRNRGILLQCRYSEISNCCFRNVVHGPIQVLGIVDVFGEAILPCNVVIKNNKFLNNRGLDVSIFSYGNTGKGVPGNIHHIDVINNYFRTISDYCIKVQSASDINVSNNLMYATAKLDNKYMRVENSKDCRFTHNKYITTNGQAPESILVIDGELENITNENNTSEVFN